MTIDRETLMAYADGELDALTAKRVERAVAADPALEREIVAQRALRDRLAHGFAPVAQEPAPERLKAMLRPAANVVPLRPRILPRRWHPGWAAAIAASLVIGVVTGQALRPDSPIRAEAGGLMAAGDLDHALDTQLAAAQDGAPLRMVASFRDGSGIVCRTFTGRATSGIACRAGDGWSLRRTWSGTPAAGTQYRQAGSTDAAVMAAAQDMMAGDPLNATQEREARDAGWR